MKATKQILILANIMFFSIQLSSQSILRVGSNKYDYNSSTYKFQEMEDIFIADFDSYQMYKSATKARKTFRISGIITLGLIPPTLLIINAGVPNNAIGLAPLLAHSISLTVTWFSGFISYPQRKNETIRLYNNSQDIGDTYNPKLWDLKISSGQYGYGLVLNF